MYILTRCLGHFVLDGILIQIHLRSGVDGHMGTLEDQRKGGCHTTSPRGDKVEIIIMEIHTLLQEHDIMNCEGGVRVG